MTDLWVWEAADHHAYELVVEALRETAFWDRWFTIVEIIPAVENAYATNYGQDAAGGLRRDFQSSDSQSAPSTSTTSPMPAGRRFAFAAWYSGEK